MKNTTNTINVTINGIEVSGTPAEVLALMSAMNGQTETTLPEVINYNTQGLESSVATPAMPKKINGNVRTHYKMIESELDGKKVYRIKSGVFWKPGDKKTGKKGKGDYVGRQISNAFIKALDGVLTGKFSWTDDNGTDHEYTGWYFTSKKKAQDAMKTLPFEITKEQREDYIDSHFE